MSAVCSESQLQLAKIQGKIRECRISLALKLLLSEREKSRQLRSNVIQLERKLDAELSKRLKCPHQLDSVLEDLLGLLMEE